MMVAGDRRGYAGEPALRAAPRRLGAVRLGEDGRGERPRSGSRPAWRGRPRDPAHRRTTARRAATEAVVDDETETETWWRAEFDVTEPGHPLPLAALGRRRRLRLGERPGPGRPRGPRRRRLRPRARRGRPGLAPRLGRLRDLPRPVRRRRARRRARPTGRCRRAGTTLPQGRGPNTPLEWFGGDLHGVEQHLDHIERLGADVDLPDARSSRPAPRTATTRPRSAASTRCSAATRRWRR